jgi:hypothetical protein
MKPIHLITPKQVKAVGQDALAAVNAELKNRKLRKPQPERKPTAIEWLRQINRNIRFAVSRTIRK